MTGQQTPRAGRPASTTAAHRRYRRHTAGRCHPSGTILTISAISDACAARAVALPATGTASTARTWPARLPRRPEAGTYPVPVHRAALAGPGRDRGRRHLGRADLHGPGRLGELAATGRTTFSLTPSADYANGDRRTARPTGASTRSTSSRQPAPRPGRQAAPTPIMSSVRATVDGLMAHVTGSKTVTASATPTPITIDGHAAQWVDVVAGADLDEDVSGRDPNGPPVEPVLAPGRRSRGTAGDSADRRRAGDGSSSLDLGAGTARARSSSTPSIRPGSTRLVDRRRCRSSSRSRSSRLARPRRVRPRSAAGSSPPRQPGNDSPHGDAIPSERDRMAAPRPGVDRGPARPRRAGEAGRS